MLCELDEFLDRHADREALRVVRRVRPSQHSPTGRGPDDPFGPARLKPLAYRVEKVAAGALTDLLPTDAEW